MVAVVMVGYGSIGTGVNRAGGGGGGGGVLLWWWWRWCVPAITHGPVTGQVRHDFYM